MVCLQKQQSRKRQEILETIWGHLEDNGLHTKTLNPYVHTFGLLHSVSLECPGIIVGSELPTLLSCFPCIVTAAMHRRLTNFKLLELPAPALVIVEILLPLRVTMIILCGTTGTWPLVPSLTQTPSQQHHLSVCRILMMLMMLMKLRRSR